MPQRRTDVQQFENGLQQLRECRFADPTESQRRHRNSKLTGRKRMVQPVEEPLGRTGKQTFLADQFFDLAGPNLDQREFRCDKESVEDHQHDREPQHQKVKPVAGLSGANRLMAAIEKTNNVRRVTLGE